MSGYRAVAWSLGPRIVVRKELASSLPGIFLDASRGGGWSPFNSGRFAPMGSAHAVSPDPLRATDPAGRTSTRLPALSVQCALLPTPNRRQCQPEHRCMNFPSSAKIHDNQCPAVGHAPQLTTYCLEQTWPASGSHNGRNKGPWKSIQAKQL